MSYRSKLRLKASKICMHAIADSEIMHQINHIYSVCCCVGTADRFIDYFDRACWCCRSHTAVVGAFLPRCSWTALILYWIVPWFSIELCRDYCQSLLWWLLKCSRYTFTLCWSSSTKQFITWPHNFLHSVNVATHHDLADRPLDYGVTDIYRMMDGVYVDQFRNFKLHEVKGEPCNTFHEDLRKIFKKWPQKLICWTVKKIYVR